VKHIHRKCLRCVWFKLWMRISIRSWRN